MPKPICLLPALPPAMLMLLLLLVGAAPDVDGVPSLTTEATYLRGQHRPQHVQHHRTEPISSEDIHRILGNDILYGGRGDRHRTRARSRNMQEGEVGSEDERPCNEEIGRITKMRAMLPMILPVDLGNLIDRIGFSLEYDVAVWKLCASCEALSAAGTIPHSSCDADKYGYDALHSWLALIPVDQNTGKIIGGHLRGVGVYHGTAIDVESVLTVSWPTSFDPLLEALKDYHGSEGDNVTANDLGIDEFVNAFFQGFPVAAAAGAVVVAPDYIGYGASLRTHNRTYAIKESYQQAAVVSWLGTQLWIANQTAGCTQLDDVVTLVGASEGGYGALSASFALRQMGIRILKVFAAAPLIDPEAAGAFLVESYDQNRVSPGTYRILHWFYRTQITGMIGVLVYLKNAATVSTYDKTFFSFDFTVELNNFFFTAIAPFSGFPYSSETPGIANTGSGQRMLNSEWTDPNNFDRNILAWLQSPNPLSAAEIFALMPQYAPEVFNPDVLTIFREAAAVNSSHPCELLIANRTSMEMSKLDRICTALISNDISQEIVNTIDYPTELCISEEDTIISHEQFTDEIFENSFVYRGTDIFGNSINGDHIDAIAICKLNPFMFLTGVTLGQPAPEPDELPFLVTPLDGNGDEICSGTPPPASSSTVPTDASPTMAPSFPSTPDDSSAATRCSFASASLISATLLASSFASGMI